jgi:hypothetical protein
VSLDLDYYGSVHDGWFNPYLAKLTDLSVLEPVGNPMGPFLRLRHLRLVVNRSGLGMIDHGLDSVAPNLEQLTLCDTLTWGKVNEVQATLLRIPNLSNPAAFAPCQDTLLL